MATNCWANPNQPEITIVKFRKPEGLSSLKIVVCVVFLLKISGFEYKELKTTCQLLHVSIWLDSVCYRDRAARRVQGRPKLLPTPGLRFPILSGAIRRRYKPTVAESRPVVASKIA